jgi:hypothetical protein
MCECSSPCLRQQIWRAGIRDAVIVFASLVFSAVLPFAMLTRSIQNYALLEHEIVLHVEAVFMVLLFPFRLLRNNDH